MKSTPDHTHPSPRQFRLLEEDMRCIPLDLHAALDNTDLDKLETWTKQINRTLTRWVAWHSGQPLFTRWVHLAVKLLIRPLRAGYAIPTWEFMLDARHCMYEDPVTGDDFTGLYGLPIEWLERAHEVALALIELNCGPLGRTPYGNDADRERATRKHFLHAMHPSEMGNHLPAAYPRPGDPDVGDFYAYAAERGLIPWCVWRDRMEVASKELHLPDPHSEHVLGHWLFGFARRPAGLQ